MPENLEAWQLWTTCNSQWRCGHTVIGLDYPAVFQVASVLSIDMTPAMLRKIKTLESYELNRLNKDAKGVNENR